MAGLAKQKDVVESMKKAITQDLGILNVLVPMPPELSSQVFMANALEKPSQNLFNHLSHYLVCIIDPVASASLPWPLHDTKAQKAYRNEISNFITTYSNKGLLGSVLTSYLVNPGCYKVTKLMFEMSELAVKTLLKSKMKKDSQKKLYDDMTAKFKSQDRQFVDQVEPEIRKLSSRLPNYLQKRTVMEKSAEKFRKKITQMEKKSNIGQKYLDDLVDGFVSKQTLDKATIAEILKIKYVRKPVTFFDNCLVETDRQIDEMESKWSEKVSPIVSISETTKLQTETLISRYTGEADKNSYMVEYNHKTDFICTKDLQAQVNSQQKYILKNIVQDEKLSFPNLIRGFLIAMCYVFKNIHIGDEIYQFNEHLEAGVSKYGEYVHVMQALMEKLNKVEAKLQPSPVPFNSAVEDILDIIPPLADLSDLLIAVDLPCQASFNSFTPISTAKHEFNLRRRNDSFAKPQLRSMAPFRDVDDTLKSFMSSRLSADIPHPYNPPSLDVSHFDNISAIQRTNETVGGCSTRFTKQQLERILSSKSNKFKYQPDRPNNINIKKGGLFNETNVSHASNDSVALIRSHSSPNLFENRGKCSTSRTLCGQLPPLPELSRSPLQVSGIAALDKDSFNSPLQLTRQKNATSMPVIVTTPASPLDIFNEMLNELDESDREVRTPITNKETYIKKTSSLQNIINRYKKIRANAVETAQIKPIEDEKDVDVPSVNRVLLPDLERSSCSKDMY